MKVKKGFTLIEVIITLAVLGAVGLLAFSLFGQGLTLYTAESESAALQEDMRLVMSEITNKVRLTDESDISVSGNQLTIAGIVYSLEGSSVLRNSSEIATSIMIFDVSITDGLLKIRIVNNKGTELSTSIYLSK